ncbi:hypothetical protein Aperf_G00000053762 [Anoplocephala perfoliata]
MSGDQDILNGAASSDEYSSISEAVQVVSAQVEKFINSNTDQDDQDSLDAKRNKASILIEKLVKTLEGVSFDKNETILPLSSALEVLAINSKDMTFEVVNRLQTKLADSVSDLSKLLATYSRGDIFRLGQRLSKFSLYLLEGMSQQHNDPTPDLKQRDLKTVTYDTDIDTDPMANMDVLVSQSIDDDQRESAKLMVAILESLNSALANALQDILSSGESALEVESSKSGAVSFCRMDSHALEDEPGTCGSLETSFVDLSIDQYQPDLIIRTSSTTNEIYNFFDGGNESPKSDLLSLDIYSKGQSVNVFKGNSSVRMILQKKLDESEDTDIEDEDQLRLPEPVLAVDGSQIYQPLLMRSFEIDNDEITFVFQLNPIETVSCPQYLVVARYIIPPNLIQLDDYGQHFWALLPSSRSKCSLSTSDDEMLLNYALYMYPTDLKNLKANTYNRTQQMKLKASELKLLYIGYRQLSINELDLYDETNPPPIPYPFTDQINTTAYVTVSIPSCLHLTAGDNQWRTGGCKVLPWANRGEILCECSNLSTSI